MRNSLRNCGDNIIWWFLGRRIGLRNNWQISLSSLLVKKNSRWSDWISHSFLGLLWEICMRMVDRKRIIAIIIFWWALLTLIRRRLWWRMMRRWNNSSDFSLVLFLYLYSSSNFNVSLAGSTSLFLECFSHFFSVNIINVECSLLIVIRISSLSLQWWLLLFLLDCWTFLKNSLLLLYLMGTNSGYFLRSILLINFRSLLPYFTNHAANLTRLRSSRSWHLFLYLRSLLLSCLNYSQKTVDKIISLLWFSLHGTVYLCVFY